MDGRTRDKPATEPLSGERDLGGLVAKKLNMSDQVWWQRANRILGCTNKGITSRDKIIIPLNLAIVRPHLEY